MKTLLEFLVNKHTSSSYKYSVYYSEFTNFYYVKLESNELEIFIGELKDIYPELNKDKFVEQFDSLFKKYKQVFIRPCDNNICKCKFSMGLESKPTQYTITIDMFNEKSWETQTLKWNKTK